VQARYEKTRDSVIFLVDSSEKMMKTGAEDKSSFDIVLELVKNVVQNKLIQGGSNEIGVCFYNTEKAKNSNGFAGIYNAIELDEPDAKMVKELERLSDQKIFRDEIGTGASECEFHRALWTCSAVFSRRKNAKISFQQIMLFTGNDRPNFTMGGAKYAELKTKATQKARDLDDLDINLVLNPINVDGTQFKISHFFADLLVVEDEDGIAKFDEQVALNFEDLKGKCYKRMFKKRALASCPMTIGDDIKIGLKLYSTIRAATKRSPVQLDSRVNQKLTCVTKWVCGETGAVLEDYQINHFYPYGREKVKFTKAEMTDIKDFGPPGIKLMGFKPRSYLKWEQNCKSPLFLRPDEGQVKGSTTAFWALLEEMINLRKIAIARVIYRKASVPRFAALLPVKENEKDPWDDKTGMYMIFLPFSDDTRSLDFPPQPVADDEKIPGLIESTRKLITALVGDVNPESYQNPSLQKHYRALEAMALEREEPEAVEDELVPSDGFQDIEAEIKAIEDIVNEIEEPEPRKRKKAAGRGGRSGGAKKAKVAVVINDADYRTLAENNGLKSLKVAQLKDFLRAKDLALSGKKADLIERIQKYFSDQDAS